MVLDERSRLLLRLKADVERLRADLDAVQEESRALAAKENATPLGTTERKRAAWLRLECERLRWELVKLRGEFDHVRTQRPARQD